MATLWFWLCSVMVAVYVVMDGYDFGAGALHLAVARTNEERRTVLGALGPFWDGNEVWLLAGGGSLFLAFPRVLGTGFSGFYLAMFLVVWALALRGISLEFRSHVQGTLWRAFWDVAFMLASAALPVLFGAALGNVLRGVPITVDGTFALPLFTDFSASNPVGLLDGYTVLVGVFALAVLLLHGSLFLAWRTEGPVHDRAAALAPKLAIGAAVLWPGVAFATHHVNPALFPALPGRPLAVVATLIVAAGVVLVAVGLRQGRHLLAFLGSGAFLLGLLAAAAASVFPVMLRSSLDPAWSLTAFNSASSEASLRTGLGWWFVGLPLAITYLTVLFRLHRGKVRPAGEGEGY
ncbi:MAG: cytochrome d ubiquinol oxidase subunit II [Holophagaceae bacterium]